MSKAPGFSLDKFEWVPPMSDAALPPKKHLSRAQKEKVMCQIGMIASQLLSLRFDKLGSIFEVAGKYEVRRCLSPGLIFHDRHTLGNDIPSGPFHHESEYYNALLTAFEAHIDGLRIQHSVFFAPVPTKIEFETRASWEAALERWEDLVAVGEKINSARNCLDYHIVKHLLQEMISSICAESSDGFPLCHQDLRTGNIFVDDDFNVTCVIDWTFTSTVPVTTLLATPSFPNPRDHHDITLDTAFQECFAHEFQPDIWEKAQKAWLFTRLIMLDGLKDYHHFKELYILVHRPQGSFSVLQIFRETEKKLFTEEKEKFQELAEELAEDVRAASNMTEREKRYFYMSGDIQTRSQTDKALSIERHAIARKITMSRDLSKTGGFVADARLWRWIEDMKKESP